MIWNALWFSNHTYRRRGNVDGAAAVQMVMNRTEGLIVPKGRKYSEKELVEIVEGIINEAAKASEEVTRHVARQEFNKGYRKGRSESPAKASSSEPKQKTEGLSGLTKYIKGTG